MKKKRLALSCSKITALLRGVTSKHDGDFYYLNFLHTFGIANKLNSMKKHVKGKIWWNCYSIRKGQYIRI